MDIFDGYPEQENIFQQMVSDDRKLGNEEEEMLLSIIPDLYFKSFDRSDIDSAQDVRTYQDFLELSTDEIRLPIQKIQKREGRYTALKYLWWRFNERSEFYDKWIFLLFVETAEIYLLDTIAHSIPEAIEVLLEKYPQLEQSFHGNPKMDFAYHQYVVLRACAFLHQYLLEKVNIDQYINENSNLQGQFNRDQISFSKVINWAKYDDLITAQTRRLIHFIREVRNVSAHNMWLDRNYSIDILRHGSECSTYILNQILALQFREHLGYDFSREKYGNELENKIEREFEWWYYEQKQTWQPGENPDGRRL
ncbi:MULTISPECIES: DUF4145 domain-containing protein [Haloferax]|uniref:DUF4145 domain-containing protein n=1 Tax=Haloferax marinum TaxID=2666143 RepID=A0A6A8GBI9_9EURY|nr:MULTISPECIES: DUF4145 domain-containing protein [Haloferax]KAB1190731.1 DUF4145 domain-containing protein [Haloferax sp. CBA1150]MRW98267.1 DUF4145 domain-containing protein [Haloferax marinum]